MRLVLVYLLTGCALHADSTPRATPSILVDRQHCSVVPTVPRSGFRHTGSRFYAGLGKPVHRGIDMIASESDDHQTIAGKLAYTAADKDIENEDVDLFACNDGGWQTLARVRTDGAGRFQLVLAGSQRLPAGMHDLYANVEGDGSGVRFLAYVARAGESVIVTDIDGTLTESENAIINTVVFGDDVGHRTDAPRVLADTGHVVVYVSSRGDQLTELTRRWLHEHGFPVGPLRLARTDLIKPGDRTVEYKTHTLRSLGIPIFAAIGNKHTDVEAYARAGIPAARTFIKLPEFRDEVRSDLAAHRAIGFDRYRVLPQLLGVAIGHQ